MPEKRGTEHSNTIQFPSRKRGGTQGEEKGGKGESGLGWKWGSIIILTISEGYKAVAAVMCALTITS